MAGHKNVSIPFSRVKQTLANLLQKEGYIEEVKTQNKDVEKVLVLKLKYLAKSPAIDTIKRISTPGRRIYVRADKIPSSLNGYGITILSTSRGIMTDKKARKEKIGGEIICQVW